VITIAIRLLYDYDPTTSATYRACCFQFDASKKWTSIFRRSRTRIVVVSQSNRNCDIGLKYNGRSSVTCLSIHGAKSKGVSSRRRSLNNEQKRLEKSFKTFTLHSRRRCTAKPAKSSIQASNDSGVARQHTCCWVLTHASWHSWSLFGVCVTNRPIHWT